MQRQINMAIETAQYYKDSDPEIIEKIDPYFHILLYQLKTSIKKVYKINSNIKIIFRGKPFFFHMAHLISVTFHVTVYIGDRNYTKIDELEKDFNKNLEKYEARLNFDKFHCGKQHYGMSINLLK